MMLTKNIDTMKAEIAVHIEADQVLQGTYWENGKGCFIGCLTHSDDAAKVTERFGMPEPLVKICEHIFERSSEADSVTFFKDIGDAIGSDGKDLSRIHWVFLRDALKAIPKQKDDIQEVINPVIEGMDLLAKGKPWSADAASAAAYATDYATSDAAFAASAASFAANTAYVAHGVPAARAASAAARVDHVNYATEIKRQRDSILALLASA